VRLQPAQPLEAEEELLDRDKVARIIGLLVIDNLLPP
jgi:hypothetical protein